METKTELKVDIEHTFFRRPETQLLMKASVAVCLVWQFMVAKFEFGSLTLNNFRSLRYTQYILLACFSSFVPM